MEEFVAKFVAEKLVTLLTKEARLLRGVHRDVRSISDELEFIAAILKEADAREARGDSNDTFEVLVVQAREVAYGIEDVMDEYFHHVAQKQFISFLHKTSHFVIKLKKRCQLANKIKAIKTTVQEIHNRAAFQNSIPPTHGTSSGEQNNLQRSSYSTAEGELVGIEASENLMLGWFEEKEVNRMVYSLAGMGGVGKTTLAKIVFDKQIGNFDCYAWITVSKTYTMQELLKRLILQVHQACNEDFPKNTDTMDEDMLINELRLIVKQNRYVVAFDDVWSIHVTEALKEALPNTKGSSIIFTTRIIQVAESHVINRFQLLKLLPFEEAWNLFCKKVFSSDCPPHLVELSQAMVKKCDGLPLAIKVVGGVLSTKQKTDSEWRKFHDRLMLGNNEQLATVYRILSLSYHDLPYYLKPCLLYFGMFPEDCSIRSSRLIRQWIAEGFVKERGTESIEDIAEDYLKELVGRSLIQISNVDYRSGKARAYRVHDLIYDVIRKISKKQKFGQHSTEGIQGRRLSILKDANISYESHSDPEFRSIFFFQMLELPKEVTIKLFKRFKLLQVLDFEDAPLSFLPDEVGILFLLKYLSIRNTKVKCLPKSIGKLQQLETLDMKQSFVHKIPVEIKRLQKLRHFLGYRYDDSADISLENTKGMKIAKGGLGCTETLQKLSFIEADDQQTGLIEQLGNCRQLKKLGIVKLTNGNGKELCNAIENMTQLHSLDVTSLNNDEVLDLSSIKSPPPLSRLMLSGRLKMLPDWISKLQLLVRINLRWSGLTDDPLPALQALPSLVELRLRDAYNGEELDFRGGFQKLELLTLRDLGALKQLKIHAGALQNLEELHIGRSPELEVPSGIELLRNLKHLQFFDMKQEFCDHISEQYTTVTETTILFNSRSGPREYNCYSATSVD